MDAHRAEMDELFGVRKRMETTLVEERLAREAAYQAELDAMQSKDAEQYTKLKVKLESDVQVLEQQLELMRSTYALNMEKLEYNFRVLSEKDTENEIAESQQKEKIKSLDRALTKVMRDYVAADKAFKAENAALTREYQRITRQYQDLQAKFSHFEAADQAKFRSVWDMHEEEVQQMLQRALAADRVISEQLLGWEWHPPTATVPRPAAALGGGTSPRHQQGQTPAGAAAAARAAA
ncbi:DRC1, partial [Symbiodinium sp. KB8]